MLSWLAENAVTIITIGVLLVIFGIAIYSVVKNKKKKSCGCSCDCATCGMNCCCDKKE